MAMSEYMSPIRMPLDMSSPKNPHSNMLRHPRIHVLDAHARMDGRLATVLVRHHSRQLDLVFSSVEGVDHGRVLVGDVAAPELSRPRHLGVVVMEIVCVQQ